LSVLCLKTRAKQGILRAVGDTLLAFMLLRGGPFDDNHALLELDDRPLEKSDQCASRQCHIDHLHCVYAAIVSDMLIIVGVLLDVRTNAHVR
jgi:hypothetical protein